MQEITLTNIDTGESYSFDPDELEDDDEDTSSAPAWNDGNDDDPDPPGLSVGVTTEEPESPDFPTAEEDNLVVA